LLLLYRSTLQVVVSESSGAPLDDGTFVAMEVLGLAIGHAPYILKHRKHLLKVGVGVLYVPVCRDVA